MFSMYMYDVLPNLNFLQFSDKLSDIFDFKLVERTQLPKLLIWDHHQM